MPIDSREICGLKFQHWSTEVSTPDLPIPGWESLTAFDDALCGTTTWRAHVDPQKELKGVRAGRWAPNGTASLKWGWVLIQPNVIVMSNPFHIQSNMELVTATGEPAPAGPALMMSLNGVIHDLAWQLYVQRSLAAATAEYDFIASEPNG